MFSILNSPVKVGIFAKFTKYDCSKRMNACSIIRSSTFILYENEELFTYIVDRILAITGICTKLESGGFDMVVGGIVGERHDPSQS